MKGFRLNRMFSALSRRCCAVAIESGLLAGIANPDRCVRLLVEAAPDAIELTVGHAELLQSIPGKSKPALVLRADVSNVHGRELPPALFSRVIGNAVEQAVRLDAACVVANFFLIPGHPALTAQCRENIQRLVPDCERFAMPLMIEPRVFRAAAGGWQPDGDVENFIPCVRQARDFGADIIATDLPDDAGVFHRVVESAGRIPVLVRDGAQAPDAEILSRAEKLIRQGAAGIVYGRNVIEHADPAELIRALMAIIHDGGSTR